MAAGLGFKTFTTGEVLTAADTNGYLMQGVLVFASAAARDAAITSPQEGQFAYLKDTNVTTYYTGSAWANLDTTGMTNPMTTTGDMVYSSPGSTPVRLGIGSTGQVLSVAGGVPSWATAASGMTLIRRSSFTNVADTGTTFDGVFTSTYKSYLIVIERLFSVSAGGDDAQFVLRYAGPTTQTSLYYGINQTCAFNASAFTFTTANNASSFTFANFIGESADVMAATITMNGVGNSSERPRYYGQGTQGTSAFGTTNFAGWQNEARTYTGIAFKSSSTNITGDVAIYGLAI